MEQGKISVEDLRAKRFEDGLREKHEVKTIVEWVKKHRRYFEYSDTYQSLLEEKKDDDLLVLQDAFMGWIEKMEADDKRKPEMTNLLKSLWRIQSYCGTLETVCKAGTAKVIEIEKKFSNYKSQFKLDELNREQEIIKLRLEVKQLKQEIEFISK